MSKRPQKIVDELRDYALGFPEAWKDFPWDHLVIKVRKKIFVFLDKDVKKVGKVRITVKLPESGLDYIEDGKGEPSGYGLGKAGWVSFAFEPGKELPIEEMREWIEESYRAVAPKTLSRLI